MQSDSVINRVNARLSSPQAAEGGSHVKIQVSLAPKTSIFNLQAFGPDASYTQAYLEATMEEYINLKKDLLANASAAAKSNLQNELAQLALKLDKSQTELSRFPIQQQYRFIARRWRKQCGRVSFKSEQTARRPRVRFGIAQLPDA